MKVETCLDPDGRLRASGAGGWGVWAGAMLGAI